MKFNCGPSPEAKRRRKRELADAEHRRLIDWHPFFTLLPRRIGENDCRWLERIERRGVYGKKIVPTMWGLAWYWTYSWEYRAKQETK